MTEVKYALKRMGLWVLIIAACDVLRVAERLWVYLPIHLISTFYLPVLSLLLIWYFQTKIADHGGLKMSLMLTAWFVFALVCMRECKYNVFPETGVVSRCIWYLYYLPLILIPLFSFYGSLMLNAKDQKKIPAKWLWTAIVSVGLIVLILTNDLHQQVFSFQPGFAEWNIIYSHRWGFWAAKVWEYSLYLATLIVMVKKCRLTVSKRAAWVPALPMVVGGVFQIAMLSGIQMRFHDILLLGFPEIIVFSVALFWEGCISIGLIPGNENYGLLFNSLSLPVWIVKNNGEVAYCSKTAKEPPKDILMSKDDIYMDQDTIIHSRVIPGGFGVWQEDISGINRMNERLESLRTQLMEESVLIRLENERKEKQAHIDSRNALYDRIAAKTRRQSEQIYQLSAKAAAETDTALKNKAALRICFYGAYIKRMANMMLMEENKSLRNSGELGLAMAESLRYLEKSGIFCHMGNIIDRPCDPKQLIAAYELSEKLIEEQMDGLEAVYVTMSEQNGIAFKMTLEKTNMFTSAIVEGLSGKYCPDAAAAGMKLRMEPEDGVLYLSLRIGEGGDI